MMSSSIDRAGQSQDAAWLEKMRWDNQVEETKKHNELTQEDFFALLTKQLSLQDPFEPMQNAEMIGQMTNFASVDGINNLKEEILNLNTVMTSNQALQASSLVGQRALVSSSRAYLGADDKVMGTVDIPPNSNARFVQVQDEVGQLVAQVPLPKGVSGNIEFVWDGMKKSGERATEGQYTFTAQGNVDGKMEQLGVAMYGHISSVSLGNGLAGTMLNIRGAGSVSIDDVIAIASSKV